MALRTPGRHPAHEARRRDRVVSGDLGLFGPSSLAWRMHRHPALLLGGLRALMVQALHPLPMAAVADFSDYRADVWGRYDRTTTYVLTTVYGTTRQAHAAGARVRAVHAPMAGVDAVTGQSYRADDPVLLLWIHAVLVESFVVAYERYVGRLTPAERDQYVAEMVRQAELVGLAAAGVPDSWQRLEDFLRSVRPQLRVSASARDALDVVLHPPLSWWRRPLWSMVAEGGLALLPDYALELYGLRRHPVRGAILRPFVHTGSAFVRRAVRPRLVIRDALLRARASRSQPPAR
ncbi:MAG: oxygenase MpaB family protein [Candidatus Dormiibacterota bacterium]